MSRRETFGSEWTLHETDFDVNDERTVVCSHQTSLSLQTHRYFNLKFVINILQEINFPHLNKVSTTTKIFLPEAICQTFSKQFHGKIG